MNFYCLIIAYFTSLYFYENTSTNSNAILALNILFFLYLALIILYNLRNSLIRIFFLLLLSIITTFELISLYAINKFIGYEFFANIEPELILAFYDDFIDKFLYSILFLIIFPFVLYLLVKPLKNLLNTSKINNIFICTLLVSFLSLQNNVLGKLYELVLINKTQNQPFQNYFPQDFVALENIEATHGKNIIVLQLESLEKGFLDEKYGNYTPNLNYLKKIYNYRDMNQNAASWTSAAIYTLMTSIKAVYPTTDNGNFWFQNISKFKIPTLGNVLHKAGYNINYAMSMPKLSGVEDLLKANYFEIISEDPGQNSGLYKSTHDLDLFNEVENRLKLLASKKEPFALFLTTLDTHFPKGKDDPEMKNYIRNDQEFFKTKMDFAIMSLDYLVGRLIKSLKKNKQLNETVFFIYPDHKMMGNEDYVKKLKEIGDRDLFLISNSNLLPNRKLKQTDMARIIIEGAEIKTNVKFLSDYKKLNYDTSTLSSLNKSIIQRKNFKSDVLISMKKNTLNVNFLNNLNRSVQLTKNDKWVTLTFNKDLNLIATKKSETKLSFFNHDWVEHSWQHPDWVQNSLELTVHIDKLKIKSAYFGNYLDTGIWFKPSLGKILIKKSQIETISDSNSFQSHFKPKEYEKNIYNISQEEYMKTNNRFIAHAGSMIDGHTYTNSLEALNQSYKSGFRLFELDLLTTSDNFFVAAHDWETWKKMSGYSGPVPVSKRTFMSYKILGKYSPLDGEMINSWFKKHGDAILITDKINEPKIFSNYFIDKQRLMMELFTVEKVIEGINSNILEVLPNASLWDELTRNHRNLFDKINYFSASRRISSRVFEEIIKYNFKIYAYDLNNEAPINEDWVICNERSKFYGLYIDQHDFLKKPIICKSISE